MPAEGILARFPLSVSLLGQHPDQTFRRFINQTAEPSAELNRRLTLKRTYAQKTGANFMECQKETMGTSEGRRHKRSEIRNLAGSASSASYVFRKVRDGGARIERRKEGARDDLRGWFLAKKIGRNYSSLLFRIFPNPHAGRIYTSPLTMCGLLEDSL